MAQFHSLDPENLPAGYKLEDHTERPIVSVHENHDDKECFIDIDYIFSGFYVTDEALYLEGKPVTFQHVSIDSTGILFESGKPMLPSLGRYLQIPRNCEFTCETELIGKPVILSDIFVSPAQTGITLPDQQKETEFDGGENGVYSLADPYPPDGRMVRVDGPLYVDGYRALILHVTPFQYYPAKRTLFGYGEVRVKVRFTYESKDPPEAYPGDPGQRKAFDNLFLNPDPGIEERFGIVPRPKYFRRLGPQFFIIYSDALAGPAQELADWKNSRGMVTDTISVSDLITQENVPVRGNKNSDAIISFLNRRIGVLSRLRYVLLLGDTDSIESKTIYSAASDYCYSKPTGPRPVSPDMWEPELLIGRIPVSTEQDAHNVVQMLIAYEKQPPLDLQHYENLTVVAESPIDEKDAEGKQRLLAMDELYQHFQNAPFGYKVDRIAEEYPTQGQPHVPFVYYPADQVVGKVIRAINEGRLLISHRGHGNENGWEGPKFNIPALTQITGSACSVFFFVNCCCGNFDLAARDCLAEACLKKCAAASLIASTTYSNEVLNNYFIKALYDGTFGGIVPPSPGSVSCPVEWGRLGDILEYAKAFMALVASRTIPVQMPDSDRAQFTAPEIQRLTAMYHVIGDPTLELWTAYPLDIYLDTWIFRNILHIRLSQCPSGCTLTIWLVSGAGRKLVTRIKPTSRSIAVWCPIGVAAAHSQYLLVCCWAPGCRYTEATVVLQP